MPLRHPSDEPAPLPQISAFTIQRGVPPLRLLAVHAPPPPLLYVLLLGIGLPPILTSAVRAYAPLIW